MTLVRAGNRLSFLPLVLSASKTCHPSQESRSQKPRKCYVSGHLGVAMAATDPKEWGAPILLGVPYDANSSYKRGAAAAPKLIREALDCESSNTWTELGVDLGRPGSYSDAGDLELPEDAEAAFAIIEKKIDGILETRRRPVSLAGAAAQSIEARGHVLKPVGDDMDDALLALQFTGAAQEGSAERGASENLTSIRGARRSGAAELLANAICVSKSSVDIIYIYRGPSLP